MNLFLRLFIAIWLAMIAIAGSWMLAARYFTPDLSELTATEMPTDFVRQRPPQAADTATESSTVRGQNSQQKHLRHPPNSIAGPTDNPHAGLQPPPGPVGEDRKPPHRGASGPRPPREIFRVIYALQNTPDTQLAQTLAGIQKRTGLEVLLFDRRQREINGKPSIEGVDEVLEQLKGFRRRATIVRPQYALFGQEIFRPQSGQLTAVIISRTPASTLLRLFTENLWLRLLLAGVISALVAYAVSRYLTRPLRQLQTASQQLAQGQLSARITVPDTGGGETGELGRSFNAMAAQLQDQIETQQRLLRDVSHELRSPLARMKVALALAESAPGQSDTQLERLEKEVGRLDELIAQLLSVPGSALELEDSLDLVGLIRELCEDIGFEAASSSKHCNFTTELTEAVVATRGDLLKKALENVTRNAISYTAEGTAVEVRLDREGDHYRVQVSDFGPGVPEEALPHLFEAFYRVDDARQRETGGYGLGLAIAHRAMQQHHGEISACNTDSGLQVTLRIPA